MISSGTVDAIRKENGNIRYDYFYPIDDEQFPDGMFRFEKIIV